MVCDSISVAIGESVHAPRFGLIAAASRSPNMPIGAGDEVIYPKKLGCPLWREFSISSSVAFSRTADAS